MGQGSWRSADSWGYSLRESCFPNGGRRAMLSGWNLKRCFEQTAKQRNSFVLPPNCSKRASRRSRLKQWTGQSRRWKLSPKQLISAENASWSYLQR